MNEQRFGFGDFLLGLVAGGAIGYGIALLFAPQTGDVTRATLLETGEKVRTQAKDVLQLAKEKTSLLIEDGREKANQTLDQSADRVAALRRRGEKIVTEKREEVSEKLHRVAASVAPESVDESTHSI